MAHNEPMTDERLRIMRIAATHETEMLIDEVERLRAALEQERAANRQLVTECEALDAQATAMRPIVAAVAEAFIDAGNGRQDTHVYRMLSVALIEQARAFVAAHPATGEGE